MSNAATVMTVVMFFFFLVGVAVGIIAVFALSAHRAGKANRQNRPPRTRRGEWPYLSEVDPDDEEPDEPRWWQARGGD